MYLQNGECKLVWRNQRNLRFDALKRSLSKLPVRNAIIDGEIIFLDEKGVSRFDELLSRKGQPVLSAFDLLWLDGEDLRQFPLLVRKERGRNGNKSARQHGGRKRLNPFLVP